MIPQETLLEDITRLCYESRPVRPFVYSTKFFSYKELQRTLKHQQRYITLWFSVIQLCGLFTVFLENQFIK